MKETILLTGATGEIGSALAGYFAKKNISLILTGRNIEKLQALKKNLEPHLAEIELAQIDYGCSDSYKNIASIKRLDGVILIPPKIAQTQNCMPSKQEWMNTFRDVFVDPLEFLKILIPLLVTARHSKVVVFSGISSKILLSNYAANGAIRAAWHAQVKAMASEYGKNGIRINTLSPGGIMTPSFMKKVELDAKQRGISFKELMAEKTSNVPLGQYASLEDICHAVDGLLSSFSDHMTGANFISDGGFLKVY